GLVAFSRAGDERAHQLFEQFGMSDLRHFYRMMIDLESQPEPPQWPDGLRVETFRTEDAQAFHSAIAEAFEDEWNFVSMPFEEWRGVRLGQDAPLCVSLVGVLVGGRGGGAGGR